MTNASRLRVIPLMMLALAASALAQTVSGTVTNGSTHRPAAGIEVTLVDPMAGMAEVGTARTDSQGRFSLSPSSPPQGPRLVRATKDGVNYFKMVPPGVPSADLEVYDSASSLEGISTVVEVLRLQGSSDILQADALYAVHNDSNPPRTLAAKSTYEITLPAGAVIDRASVQGPGGQPIGTTATPLAQKNHYGFSYPLKPGETRFQIAYHMPYSGQAGITPELPVALQHFVVVLPESMKWTPSNAAAFQPMPNQPGMNVQVAASPRSAGSLAFIVSGTGTIAEAPAEQSSSGSAVDSRPGGGLGPPIDAPDALANVRRWVLGALALTLCGGAFITLRRSRAEATASAVPGTVLAKGLAAGRPHPVLEVAPAPKPVPPALAQSAPMGNLLLDAVKDELFQLELERHSGSISETDYARQKAGLDATLARLLAKAGNRE